MTQGLSGTMLGVSTAWSKEDSSMKHARKATTSAHSYDGPRFDPLNHTAEFHCQSSHPDIKAGLDPRASQTHCASLRALGMKSETSDNP